MRVFIFIFYLFNIVFRDSYDAFFAIVKSEIEKSNLNLGASWFLSDYELNIRNSFQDFFPEVQLQGFHFHFAQVIFIFFLWKEEGII